MLWKNCSRISESSKPYYYDAVHKAFLAVELGDGARAENVTKEVVGLLEEKFREKIPSVEDVQDTVIEVLKKRGYEKVAREYQDYRKKKEEIRALREKLGIEPKLTVNALEVLKARYLLRDEKENIIETPTRLFERVAKAIAKVDKTFGESSGKNYSPLYIGRTIG
ncbi:MAG TPA: ATP cone domain-containing protein [Candidatus Bathyarchaeia archaeon]|nr:ATP cone domain-containing protein [Candidatus Bathyarchaeia archaeon]